MLLFTYPLVLSMRSREAVARCLSLVIFRTNFISKPVKAHFFFCLIYKSQIYFLVILKSKFLIIAPFFNAFQKRSLFLFAYGVTDESFAVNYVRFKAGHWDLNRALVVNHVANFTWIASSVLGAYSRQFIPAGAFGIDYALIAMFICLLVFQLRGRIYLLTAVVSGGVAVVLAIMIPGNSYVILASTFAATVGVLSSAIATS